VECSHGEAVPAFAAGEEVDVDEEKDGEEVVGDCDGDRGSDKTPFEFLEGTC
jgi:hypothetical protein